MAIVLYHHPWSRAAAVVWMLEEVGCDYALRFVDIDAGDQKSPEFLDLNPMGKIPVLVDGHTVVTEGAAIGLYLADRYAYGRLAPAVDDPARGPYLRWSLFAPSVVEPGTMAKRTSWQVPDRAAGWGTYDAMITTLERAVGQGPWLLGETFTMADVIFGSMLRYLVGTKMLEARPSFAAYIERLNARPALQRADARNAAVARERGLTPS